MIKPEDRMRALHAFTLISLPASQGIRIGVERCWIGTKRMPDERSRNPCLCRVVGEGKKTRSKKKSLRPELNWGPTG